MGLFGAIDEIIYNNQTVIAAHPAVPADHVANIFFGVAYLLCWLISRLVTVRKGRGGRGHCRVRCIV